MALHGNLAELGNFDDRGVPMVESPRGVPGVWEVTVDLPIGLSERDNKGLFTFKYGIQTVDGHRILEGGRWNITRFARFALLSRRWSTIRASCPPAMPVLSSVWRSRRLTCHACLLAVTGMVVGATPFGTCPGPNRTADKMFEHFYHGFVSLKDVSGERLRVDDKVTLNPVCKKVHSVLKGQTMVRACLSVSPVALSLCRSVSLCLSLSLCICLSLCF
jgi:hypothetical protein